MENENTHYLQRPGSLRASKVPMASYQQKFEEFKRISSSRKMKNIPNQSTAQLIMSQRDPNRLIDSPNTSNDSSYVLGDSNGDFSDSDDSTRNTKRRSSILDTSHSKDIRALVGGISSSEESESMSDGDDENESGLVINDNFETQGGNNILGSIVDENKADNINQGSAESEEHDSQELSPLILSPMSGKTTNATSTGDSFTLTLVSPSLSIGMFQPQCSTLPPLIPEENDDVYEDPYDIGENNESDKTEITRDINTTHYSKVDIKPQGKPLALDTTPLILQGIAPLPVTSAGPFFNVLEYNANCPTPESLLFTILEDEMSRLDPKSNEDEISEDKQLCFSDYFFRIIYRLFHFGDMRAEEYVSRYPWEKYYDASEYANSCEPAEEETVFNFDMMPFGSEINPFTSLSNSWRAKRSFEFIQNNNFVPLK